MSNASLQLDNTRVLVVGCGATGVSAACFAARHGAMVRVIDSRATPPRAAELRRRCPQAELLVGGLPLSALASVDQLLVSPGIDLREPLLQTARQRGLPMCGDIEWFARRAQAPVVAITGSNGKSTVTAWLAEIAEAAGASVAVGGNFGTPALDLLAPEVSLYVLELSSFQLALTEQLDCVAATVLNISPDHIDRHGDLASYASAKARIFKAAETAIVNADDAVVAAMDTGAARVVRFGTTAQCDYALTRDSAKHDWLARGPERWLACSRLQLRGRHNHCNALAAWALAEAAGLDAASIETGLCRFSGLPHRCQWVARIAGVDWINDSKGTNPGALLASLAGMEGPLILLAGGQGKGADFTPLAAAVPAKARAVIVFGEDAAIIAAVLANRVAVHRVDNLVAAVALAAELAQVGDTVLLSPGCASLDQFADYAQRGEAFMAAVQELAA
ncbi:MAG TPA: UDP-N-acetylmuramoyl-L-alanine--D-glutamate ligase [Salinisphaeraceae bacterium]|nr:UDP-N-acetylmuramoyl-L-alanine--D-glutamate ligase [Salinisphaeraceae bacterium]